MNFTRVSFSYGDRGVSCCSQAKNIYYKRIIINDMDSKANFQTRCSSSVPEVRSNTEPKFGPEDDYGVPTVIFGGHHQDFFPLLGRVIALASVIDKNLRYFVNNYGPAGTGEESNESAGNILKKAKQLCEDIEDEETKEEILRYLSGAKDAIDRRNLYAHNLWPAFTCESGTEVVGWGKKKYSADHKLGEDLEELRKDVLVSSELIIRWINQIQPLAVNLFTQSKVIVANSPAE